MTRRGGEAKLRGDFQGKSKGLRHVNRSIGPAVRVWLGGRGWRYNLYAMNAILIRIGLGIRLKRALAAIIALAVAGFCLWLATWAVAAPVGAHGGGFQLTRPAVAGPYELLLGTIPDPLLVGEGILILQVANPDTGERVLGARVEATAAGPDGATLAIPFGPDSYDPTLYEANATLDAEGAWLFIVEVSGADGGGSAKFDYEVRRASPIAGIITLATLLALLTILGLSMRAFLKQRGSRR